MFSQINTEESECFGKVDYVVIDSPILFSTIYHRYYTKGYPKFLQTTFS